MAQRTDLYSILMSYADKHHSPYVDIDSFTTFLDKHARRSVEEAPEWKKWTYDFIAKFWAELNQLVEEKKCVLIKEGHKNQVFFAEFYVEKLQRAYYVPEKSADLPFPDEKNLELRLPAEMARPLTVRDELGPYLSAPQETALPILKLSFPEPFGTALVLASMIPRQLLETALLKLRGYLRTRHNRDFFRHKLSPSLPGKDLMVKQLFDQLEANPASCIEAIEGGGDLVLLFWTHFCGHLIAEAKKKSDLLAGEIGAAQSAFLIEVFIDFFKDQAHKVREREEAYKQLAARLNQPPFLYTLDDIIQFTNPRGDRLLDYYSAEDLGEYLQKKTAPEEGQTLPELLIVTGKKNERYFIGKTKAAPLCIRLLNETRPRIKKAIADRWAAMIRDFRDEPAMERDSAFEQLAAKYTIQFAPVLSSLLGDPRLPLIYDETDQAELIHPETSRLFFKGQLLPMTTLLLLKRKDLLGEVRLTLPFWYSMPVLSRIFAFFWRLGRQPKQPAAAANAPEGDEPAVPEDAKPAADFKALAKKYQQEMIPGGYTLDSYLEELESHWRRLLNQEDQKNLTGDVQNLIRDKLRIILRQKSPGKFSRENLNRIAETIVRENPRLSQLDEPEALQLYVKLYVTKLIILTKM
jgi:PAS domain-containing protein